MSEKKKQRKVDFLVKSSKILITILFYFCQLKLGF